MTLTRFVLSQLKHARRYNRVIRVLLRHGFDHYVANLNEKKKFGLLRFFVSKSRRKRLAQYNKWQRMRMVCEDLGPTFVKFGQLLSNRRDLIPEPLIEELTRLQDNVPPFSSKLVRKIIKEELKKEPEELFAQFDEQPFASASMAQVHKAKLKTGEEVVLKIQRPEIRKLIEDDLKIMRSVAKALSKRIPSLNHFDPEGLVEQFANSIFYEMDFLHEAVNMKRFQYYLKDQPSIKAPQVYDEFSTIRLLTMERIVGVKPVSKEHLAAEGIDASWVARELANSFFKQAFVHGYFHADPHAGNLLVNDRKEIHFLDFGMMGSILRKDMQHLGMLILAIEKEDVNMMMRSIMSLTDTVAFDNRRRLEYDLIEYINKYAFTSNFHLHISQMLSDLVVIIRQHNLKVPSHFFLLIRASFSVEGLVRHLDPEIELMSIIRPILEARLKEEMNPLSTGKRILNSLYGLASYLEDFPSDLRQTMKMLRRGKIKVDLEHKGMDPFIYTLRRVSQQMVYAILVSAIFVCSVVFVLLDTKPMWGNVSAFGVIGFSLSGLLGIILFIRLRKAQLDYEDRDA